MPYKRVLTVQDISCLGQCSITVALPVLSACGHETCIIPSAVLSTHTGGSFEGYTFRDLTEDIPAICRHWQQQGCRFDAVYAGYLGSLEEVGYVRNIFGTLLKPGGKIVVDPAMGDNGKLYAGFNTDYAAAIAGLCAGADVILPNVTEACFMTGMEYREPYDGRYLDELLLRLTALGAENIILTGVGCDPESTGVMVRSGGETRYYRHPRIPQMFHGTGDVYASAFVGAWLRGKDIWEAAGIAVDFTVSSIKHSLDDPEHWYGVKFEKALPELMKAVY